MEIPTLEEAKKRFPIGTVFSNKNLGYDCDNIEVVGDYFKYHGNEILIARESGKRKGFSTSSYTVWDKGVWAEKTEIINSKISDMEELLAKAYEDYPIGTKFICKYSGKIREVQPYSGETTVTYRIEIHNIRCDNGMFTKHIDGSSACSNPAIYEDGTWAEIIIEEPKYEIY